MAKKDRFEKVYAQGTLTVTQIWVRSEEHTSELQSQWSISYAVFCLKKFRHVHLRLHQH